MSTIEAPDTIRLTVDDVKDAMRRAVERYGADYVDPNAAVDETCQYLYHDGRRCIAGEVLTDLVGKHDPDAQRTIDSHPGTALGLLNDLRNEHGVQHEPTVASLLNKAQTGQDHAEPWGEAVDHAIVEAS